MKLQVKMTSRIVAAVLVAQIVAWPAAAQPAQSGVAALKDMEGTVLVNQGDAMVAATPDQRLPVGARVVTTAGAKVTINYDAGCDVRLNENQRFTVRVGPCGILLAEVEALGPAAGAIGGEAVASAAGAEIGTIAGIGGIAALAAGAVALFRNNPVSPN